MSALPRKGSRGRRRGRSGVGICYRRDGRVVVRLPAWLGANELLIGKVERLSEGWHFCTTVVAPAGRDALRDDASLVPDPFDFHRHAEPYPRRHLATKALIKLLNEGAAVDDAWRARSDVELLALATGGAA